ncbi:MAG: RtcB family protein [Bacteroidota bacterium]
MAKLKLRKKDLENIGYPSGRIIGLVINTALRHYKRRPKEIVLELLASVLQQQEKYKDDPIWKEVVLALQKDAKDHPILQLLPKEKFFPIYGAQEIEEGAKQQMRLAMRLPITVAGALMPDAHQGYGLPIGGVLATENAIIPYAVGVDIGCRMALTLYDLKPDFLQKSRVKLKDILLENTRFGYEGFEQPMGDEVLENPLFKEIHLLKRLQQKARQQIGSSGSGNHFVEFGIVDLKDERNEFDLPLGQYLGVLSHSGSRGLGANIAQHYTKRAMENCRLPREAKHLAWLDLDTEAGEEYWNAMNLAGDYASACHDHIHRRLAKALGENPIAKVENHHNFAWKEQLADGRSVIVHRKGATPAGKGVLGIIPGSMSAPGYIVRGRGHPIAISSASHGAGRLMSRTQAKKTFNHRMMKDHLKAKEVDLIGGGLDESPFAYKDINTVMNLQTDLVDIVGSFTPKIVRMDAEKKRRK